MIRLVADFSGLSIHNRLRAWPWYELFNPLNSKTNVFLRLINCLIPSIQLIPSICKKQNSKKHVSVILANVGLKLMKQNAEPKQYGIMPTLVELNAKIWQNMKKVACYLIITTQCCIDLKVRFCSFFSFSMVWLVFSLFWSAFWALKWLFLSTVDGIVERSGRNFLEKADLLVMNIRQA